MRIIFFGSGQIAVPSLEALIKTNEEVLCVVTAPDKKRGRHLINSFTPVKEFALGEKLNIFQPENPSVKNSIDYLKQLNPDIFIVFSFGKILSKELLSLPKLFAVNIHASLLPKYRGAAPINWALINGETKTGITIIRMNEKMDQGDIILKKEVEIENFDNAISIQDKLDRLAPIALEETLNKIKKNEISFSKQNNSEASYAPKLKKENGRIDWNKSAYQIKNQIRGLMPWPGCYAFYENTLIKIWSVEEITAEKHVPGQIIRIDKKGILAGTGSNALLIKELQLESGKRLDAWRFIQGHKLEIGKKFS